MPVRTTTLTYSIDGQIASIDGPRNDVSGTTTFSYYNCTTGGQCGQRHTATNALGHVITFNDYDAHGNVLRLTDANGVQTVLTYDLRQLLLTSTVAGATTSYTYDPVGNITRVTSPDGSYLAYTWDQANRLVAIEDALANRMEWDLDAADNRTATRYKDSAGTLRLNQSQQFDELSRLIKTVYAVSGESSYGYDKNGNRTSSVEPGGATTSSGYDALNRLVSSTNAAQGVTSYGYDSQDNLTTVTDATGNTTTYSYNGFGDLLQLDSPDTGTTTYTVDAAGNRLSETDARDVTVSYQYDALNRLVAKSYADSSSNVTYSYDQGVNGIGRLSHVNDSTGSTAYSFDARGNITEQRSTIGGVLYTTGYSFDAANKLTGTTYPSGRSLAYGYDTAGRLSSISHTGDGTSETLISNLQYLPFGPMTGYTLGNGAVRTVEYDLDYRIGRIADGAILDRNYSYSGANNISGITDALAATNTQLFGYDDLNRLTSAAGAYGSHGYDYDAVGNRTQFSADAGNQSYSYATGSNRLTDVGGASRSRDAAGNLTQTNGNTFSYGEHNRLSGVTGLAGNVQYGHNALGQRVSKTANGTTRHYLFDRQGQLVGEANSDGSEPVEYAYLNGQPLAMWRAPAAPVTLPVPVALAPLGDIDTASPANQWQSVSAATRYQFLVRDQSLGEHVYREIHTAEAACLAESCSVTPSDLSLGYHRNHVWRVRAGDAAGWGDWSEPQRFHYLPAPPAVIAPVAPLGDIDSASPAYQWEAVAGASKYQLLVRDRSLGARVHNDVHPADGVCETGNCTVTVGGLALGYHRNHVWRVRAGNLGGWGEWSAPQRFHYLPSPPAAVSPVAPLGAVDTASPRYQWAAVEGASKYQVLVRDKLLGERVYNTAHPAETLCSAESCSLTPAGLSLSVSDNHLWRVRAGNLGGWGEWSPPQRFHVGAAAGGQ